MLLLAPLSARAADADPPGRFLPFVPLSLQDLYIKRMRFAGGEPMISVGIMEGQRSVTLRADGPTRLMLDEASVPKTIYAPPATRFTLKPLKTTPPKIRFWVVVETRPYRDVLGVKAVLDRWKVEGFESASFEVGTIVALQGNVLDTRARRVGIGGYSTRAEAEATAAKLFTQKHLRTAIHEQLLSPPGGNIGVYDERGRLLHRAIGSVYFGTVEGGQIEIRDVEHGRGYDSHGHQTRKFWGHIYVAVDRSEKLAVVSSVGAERLLAGLVPAEIFATAPQPALQAQAVTARGEIFSKLGQRHFGEPYHLCSEQHCQVYSGAGFERPETNLAVEKTRGLLAVRPRANDTESLTLVDSVYSSTCGGFSEANEVVWDDRASDSLRPRLDGAATDPALAPFAAGITEDNIRAWLESFPPTACARSTFARADKVRWKKTVFGDKLTAIAKKQGVGALTDLKILGRGKSGRVTGVRLVGTDGSVDVLRELPVRRLFGNLNSGMFVVDLVRRQGVVQSVTFTGGGWGHGVGMCQVGAIGRAERGQTFEQILSHYYSGAVVERIY